MQTPSKIVPSSTKHSMERPDTSPRGFGKGRTDVSMPPRMMAYSSVTIKKESETVRYVQNLTLAK